MADEKKLSYNLKKYRNMRGFTQTDISRLLYVSCQTVSKWENGISYPDIGNLCALANVLNVSVDRLLTDEDENVFEKFFIGIDGGGTKTEFVLFSQNGKIINRVILGGTNPNVYGMDNILAILSKGIETLLLFGTNVSGVFAGIAGSGIGKNREKISSFIRRKIPGIPVTVESDICNVISSVRGIRYGISVIWGTGITVAAHTAKGIHRIGGWGYLFENLGSGYAIGNAVIRNCLACNDRLLTRSLLTEMAEEKLGGKISEKLDYIYECGKDYIASYAPIAFEAYMKGDSAAEKIIEKNIMWLATLINKAAEDFDGKVKTVISGGLTAYEDILKKYISKNINDGIDIVIPKMPQIYGACLSCMNMCGKKDFITDDFEKNFKSGYTSLTYNNKRSANDA